KTAHIKKLKNGTLQLGMRVSALEQVIPWVLSFGRRARVLEPVELKDRVRKEIRAMNKKYGNPS
ncbi:MAG: WYL domain-containing protein, partial [Nitrospinaceae bacterium]|nr:WYL domain-containing protein [Nitrospinaceae bacterium]NIR55714.1 WYL domain-containing protein [Nitrospinaceae bacterium]NIS83732.1 WYL domain-containing protein [Nitrospinaceae bacterium]NIT80529.1 WYL domain-containing protein [Nitrospinaceae bacterium]NIU42856.1 WYL domain-containing protein [Nitrospinaceae bacterium]